MKDSFTGGVPHVRPTAVNAVWEDKGAGEDLTRSAKLLIQVKCHLKRWLRLEEMQLGVWRRRR